MGPSGTIWHCQDGRGNTSHLVSPFNQMIEHYVYGLAGRPLIYDPGGNLLAQSSYGNRFMFQGRDYLKEPGLYDYRNRFYQFALGRFLQPDPIGFAGDSSNLYRYCGNDSGNGPDPYGLVESGGSGGGKPPVPLQSLNGTQTGEVTLPEIVVPGDFLPGDFLHELQGWQPLSELTGGFTSLSQGGGLGWLGGVSVTLGNNPAPSSFLPIPTIPAQSLPPAPAVPSFQPSGGFPGNVPQSSGFLFNAQADAGLIYGAGANYTAAYGMYDADKNGGWQSFGGMAGGPTGAYSIVDPKSASQIPLI